MNASCIQSLHRLWNNQNRLLHTILKIKRRVETLISKFTYISSNLQPYMFSQDGLQYQSDCILQSACCRFGLTSTFLMPLKVNEVFTYNLFKCLIPISTPVQMTNHHGSWPAHTDCIDLNFTLAKV